MENSTGHAILARLAAGLVMGGLTLVLVGLGALLGPPQLAAMVHPLVRLLLPAAGIAMILIAVLSTTARTAWGRLCLANGVVSIVLAAASLQTRGQPLGAADPLYESALDQGVRWWLGHLMWTATAYACVATVAGLVFFTLSYWLLRWPSGQHRATS